MADGKAEYGQSATIATTSGGLYGIEAEFTFPKQFQATGRGSFHYFDGYIGHFATEPATAFIEAGLGYYGEQGGNPFPGRWQTFVNPLGGHVLGAGLPLRFGQRNAVQDYGRPVRIRLIVDGANHAQIWVDERPFMGGTGFTYGFDAYDPKKHKHLAETQPEVLATQLGHGVSAATFKKGFNFKACVGYADEGPSGGVGFSEMTVRVTRAFGLVKDQIKEIGVPDFRLINKCPGAQTRNTAHSVTVAYPGRGG